MNKDDVNSFIAAAKEVGTGSKTKALKTQPQDFTTGNSGSISGYFATFDHDKADSAGDVIRKGAFLKTIADRKQTGHPFPLCFNHDFSCIIGRVTDIGEDEKGAYFTAEFFPTEKAQEVRGIVKSGALWQCSFAYDVLDQGKVKAGDGTTVNELRELQLFEISIVTVPANPRAVITDVKTDANTGKKLSPELIAKRDRLLNFIRQNEAKDRDKRKRQLLDSINETLKDDTEAELKKYRDMEAQALKDIGKAEAEGLTDWKRARITALNAIREEIKRLSTNRKKTGATSIKTGSRPLNEPKATIK